ncbi:MAG TPA: protein kinase [Vicinamibacterales bacterium]
MRLSPGARIGPYEILSDVGAGGMGEVYRAHDSRLKRDVAIKVLPVDVAADADRLARFQREAELLASLNHPHVAHVYGIEDGALVMELVEGEDLSQRLRRGPVPIDEALAIAKQIADGLDAAHLRGIIHRDLKPGNIKIRADGTVKILDFGLAKVLAPQDADMTPQDLSQSPTILSATLTERGVILGTAAYMSPEQAKGRAIDKRTDIWAFGCVLFEMLTGKRPFGGGTATEVVAAILERQPDWSALPPGTPTAVRRLLRRALEKNQATRLRDIGDARLDLNADDEIAPPPPPSRLAPVVALLTAAIGFAAATAYWRSVSQPLSNERPLIFTIPNTQQAPISADGSTIAWVAPGRDGTPRLWARRLNEPTAREFAGTEGATQPFLAPDGRAIAFFQRGLLKRVDVATGAIQTLTTSATVSPGGTWSVEDVILFSNRYGLQRISADGGEPRLVVPLNPAFHENSLRYPQFLPDGKHFVYAARSGQPEESGAYLGSLDAAPRRLFSTLAKVAFVAPDQLLFVRDTTLFAQTFDVATATLSGSPRTITSDLWVQPIGLNAFYWAAQDGTLTYIPSRPTPGGALRWFDRGGRDLGPFDQSRQYVQFRLSPDGKRVAASLPDPARGSRNVWLIEPGRAPARFTFPNTHDWEPVWSPDGRRIGFGSYRNGPLDLYIKDATGSMSEVPLLLSDNQKDISDWSPDGKYIIYRDTRGNANGDLVAVEVANPRNKTDQTNAAGDEQGARWSGDGKWIAYVSNETGESEVFVQPFPSSGGRWQISVGGGAEPAWRRDGRELYYIDRDGMLVAVTVDGTAASFSPPKATPLFRIGANRGDGFQSRYDVTADGTRFLVLVDDPAPSTRPPVAIVNWPALASAR